MTYVDLTVRLLLSILFGGIIGIERESVNRPAGFRTHILVCVGSTLTMLVSLYIFELFQGKTNLDPARIAAQVVSGIGFLGAGTIIREGSTVRGLTTAASLWTIAAIGLAIGCGFYFAASMTTVLTFTTLISLSKFENRIIKKRSSKDIILIIKDSPGQIGKIGTILGDLSVTIKNIRMNNIDDEKLRVCLNIETPSKLDNSDITMSLSKVDGILSVECEDNKFIKTTENTIAPEKSVEI